MKILIPNQSKQGIGGGWTFLRTFAKYAEREGALIVSSPDQKPDIALISGATMVERAFAEDLKERGIKIVLRIDNIPRNSRNRNTGTSRLFDFAQMADLVIYQSSWARDYIRPFVLRDGPIIINGADEAIFNPDGPKQPREAMGKSLQYLYVQYNRDETKQWHQAWYEYIMRQRKSPDGHLWIVGQFSPEQIEYNFDFFGGERFRYVGVLEDPEDMAEYMRSVDVLLMPYFNDACSNTMIEYLLCNHYGVVWENGTGGNEDIRRGFFNSTEKQGDYLHASRMVKEYLQEFSRLI